MSKYKLCRGFRDLMPSDYKKYMFLKDTIEEVSNVYGYKMIQTCCIEESNLYEVCYKDDLSSKLFEIENRFTNNVSLNYDSSVSVLRSVVENKLYVDKSLPLKLMYLKEVYKHDKKDTSKASNYEFGFECVGEKSPYLDIENILMNLKIVNFLGFGGYILKIKNIGEDDSYYLTFKETLDNLGIDYKEDESVRVKGYYTGIAYNIDIDDVEGVVVGGRYDNLIDDIGNVEVGCIGSQINFDLLIKLMDRNEVFPDFKEEVDFYIIPVSSKCYEYALYISETLRDLGAIVEIHYKEYDLKRLDDLLDRVNVTYSLVVEEEDIKKKTVKVRNSLNKKQSCVLLKDFIKDLESLDDHHHQKGEFECLEVKQMVN